MYGVEAGLVSSISRKNTIILGGCIFLVGSAINGGAENIAMLISSRTILLGFGIGFTNQVS
ncbi:Sugar transport protein 5, partial [Mucuna pruriens]